jgi:hypothetical protein
MAIPSDAEETYEYHRIVTDAKCALEEPNALRPKRISKTNTVNIDDKEVKSVDQHFDLYDFSAIPSDD